MSSKQLLIVLVALGLIVTALRVCSGTRARELPIVTKVPRQFPSTAGHATDLSPVVESQGRVPPSPPRREIGSSLVVVVADESGSKVSGAHVELRHGEGPTARTSRATDGEGSAVFEAVASFPLTVGVKAQGLVGRELVVERTRKEPLLVIMSKAQALAGRVVSVAGVGVPGARVLAWSTLLRRLRPDVVKRVAAGLEQGVYLTTCNQEGYFSISDVNPNTTYNVLAASDDSASRGEDTRVSTGKGAVVTVFPAYGLRVLSNCPEPEALALLAMAAPPQYYPLQGRSNDERDVLDPHLISALGGWDTDPRPDTALETLFVWTLERDTEALGELRYRLKLPCFKPTDIPIVIPRIHGRVPEFPVLVESIGLPFSMCSIRLRMPQELRQTLATQLYDLGYLELRRVNDSGIPSDFPMFLPFDRSSRDRIEVPLPYGRYTVRYRCRATGACEPPSDEQPLVLDTNAGVSSLLIDLVSMGGLQIRVLDSVGGIRSGELSVLFRRDTKSDITVNNGASWCSDAPYIFAPLQTGPVLVQVRAHIDSGPVKRNVEVTVEAGKVLVLDVELP